MYTLQRTVSLEQIVKKSRFIAFAGPVASEHDAKAFVARHSDPGANHNCWAWRIGQNFRSSDDGEPGGTAGKPILQAIDRLDLDNVAVVVTRWFGGILLGSGGLVRAYGGTAAACLRASTLIEIVPVRCATFEVSFADLAIVKARLARTPGVNVRDERFTATGVCIVADLPEADAPHVLRMIMDVTSGRASVSMED